MSQNAKKGNNEKAETKASWKITTLYVVFGSLLFATLWWARNDTQSEVAWKIRNLLGIQLLEEPAPEPEPKPVEATPVAPVPEPEPEPEPEEEAFVVAEPEPPEPEALDWGTYKKSTNLWPDTLNIMEGKKSR